MVITFAAQVAETPAGKPFAPVTPLLEIPVAPEVVWVIFVIAEFKQTIGVDDAGPAVLTALTVRVPVAFTDPQPPVNGML